MIELGRKTFMPIQTLDLHRVARVNTVAIPTTLESRINVLPRINVAPGKFVKKNKRSPIHTLYLYHLNRLYEVGNKALAPEKKTKN